MQTGIERSLRHLRQRRSTPQPDARQVTLQIFPTGYVTADRKLLDRSGIHGQVNVHATVALITHPEFGSILFDAGYSPAFFDATSKLAVSRLSLDHQGDDPPAVDR